MLALCSGSVFGQKTMEIKVYLIAEGENVKNATPNSAVENCGSSLVAVSRTKTLTTAPLKTALDELITTPNEIEEGGLKLANYWRGDLKLKSVSLANGIATIQITGKLSSAGICDDVRIQEQLEATAKQFPTVKTVKVFVNGTALNEEPQPTFEAFWLQFKSAVEKRDKAAVAALSKFPLSMPYGWKVLKTKADLIENYDEVFYSESLDADRCFANTAFEKRDEQYEVACGFKSEPLNTDRKPWIYHFELTENGWRFARFDNINE